MTTEGKYGNVQCGSSGVGSERAIGETWIRFRLTDERRGNNRVDWLRICRFVFSKEHSFGRKFHMKIHWFHAKLLIDFYKNRSRNPADFVRAVVERKFPLIQQKIILFINCFLFHGELFLLEFLPLRLWPYHKIEWYDSIPQLDSIDDWASISCF